MFAKCMEEIKKPKLTNQRLAWLIKRDPCRKARLLGIKKKTLLEQIIPPLGVKREASPSTKSREEAKRVLDLCM
jgi:hypothetical protein